MAMKFTGSSFKDGALSRRSFLVGTSLVLAPARLLAQTSPEREHRPQLDIPLLADDPTAVPVRVWVDHPMEPDHFVRSIEVRLDSDPVPYKGTFLFGPANGRAAVAFKMRSGTGGVVRAVAECSRHGRFSGTREIRVVEGGCTTPPEATARERPRNAQVRLPEPIAPGQIVEVRARVEHNSDTGLRLRNGRFVREAPEFYLKEILVFLDDQRISEFRLGPAVSANPLIRFPLRVSRSGTLKVVFVNSEGQRAEASQAIRLG